MTERSAADASITTAARPPANVAPCPCCGTQDFYAVVAFRGVPVSGVYRVRADDPIQEVDLLFEACRACSLLRRRDFAAPVDYSVKERSTRAQFPAYVDVLLDFIDRSVSCRDHVVVEIGSNDGAFLDLLKRRGYRNLVGIEPAIGLAETARSKGLRVESGYFDSEMARTILSQYGSPAMVVCRHTLEHVPQPNAFVGAIRELLAHGGRALIEVPDSSVIHERLNFMELWDEHMHYFTGPTLAMLLRRGGLQPDAEVVVSHLDTQNLIAWVRPQTPPQAVEGVCGGLGEVDWSVFARRLEAYRSRLHQLLAEASRPICVMGASHPQCNFVNFLELERFVDYMVDDDPAKAGTIPPTRESRARVIDSDAVGHVAAGGTLLLTAFGYPAWIRAMSAKFAGRLTIIDPLQARV